MNSFLIFASIFALAFARPDGLLPGNDGHVSVTQSSLGSYKYIVQLKDSSRTEQRLEDGTIIGEYTIPGANGLPFTVKYTAGPDGFKILEEPVLATLDTRTLIPVAQGLPLPVEDTPEVKAAREKFFALYRAAAAQTVV